ncbi:MAG: two-component system nitrogen regulation sensor histidine kinase NtrY [Saprospiraceae bacterium]
MIKRFTIQVAIRIILIVVCCVFLAFFFNKAYWFSASGFGVLIIMQVVSMIRYVNQTNYSLVRFLEALKNEDYSVYFSPSKKGDSFAEVFKDFNTIIGIFKRNKIEKEVQYKHFQQILEHVNLGIISIHKEDLDKESSEHEILFLNKAASDLFDQPRHKYWHRFARQVPWFAEEVRKLSKGGKKLIELSSESQQKQLSLEVVNIRFLDISYLIITFQDIHSEIEQKEMEAWHNVIRVLAHEMLNSFTPVSSLASTIKSMTEDEKNKPLTIENIDDETIIDINLAATTIQRRSVGLLDFVKDYRTISNVPVPQLKEVNIKAFLTGIRQLMKPVLEEHNIALEIGLVPSKAIINIDTKLIEQVFINIIQNSIYALENSINPRISISCEVKQTQTIISVTDNGKGIEEEILKQIFVPFYTTRKDGSGIGLSLSKSILNQHKGNLIVSSEPGIFTTFSLVFRNEWIG